MSVPDVRLVRAALGPLLRRVRRNAFGARTTGVDLAAFGPASRLSRAERRAVEEEAHRLLAFLSGSPGDDPPTRLAWRPV